MRINARVKATYLEVALRFKLLALQPLFTNSSNFFLVIHNELKFLWSPGTAYRESPSGEILDTPTAVANVFIPLATPLIADRARFDQIAPVSRSGKYCDPPLSWASWQGSTSHAEASPQGIPKAYNTYQTESTCTSGNGQFFAVFVGGCIKIHLDIWKS